MKIKTTDDVVNEILGNRADYSKSVICPQGWRLETKKEVPLRREIKQANCVVVKKKEEEFEYEW